LNPKNLKTQAENFTEQLSKQKLSILQIGKKKKEKMRYRDLEPGEVLYREKDAITTVDCYFLKEGTVNVRGPD
jgi:CRP-like cAMP-binding protein